MSIHPPIHHSFLIKVGPQPCDYATSIPDTSPLPLCPRFPSPERPQDLNSVQPSPGVMHLSPCLAPRPECTSRAFCAPPSSHICWSSSSRNPRDFRSRRVVGPCCGSGRLRAGAKGFGFPPPSNRRGSNEHGSAKRDKELTLEVCFLLPFSGALFFSAFTGTVHFSTCTCSTTGVVTWLCAMLLSGAIVTKLKRSGRERVGLCQEDGVVECLDSSGSLKYNPDFGCLLLAKTHLSASGQW